MTGEVQPLDISPRAKGYQGMWKRVPIGPCCFISPFNFPLNLAAHKIAPAIAVGCPFVMKPASRTPLGAIIMGEVLAETDLPKGAFSILPAHRDGRRPVHHRRAAEAAVASPARPAVGWDLKAKAGKKKVVLELGGNAAVIVDEDADLDDARRADHLRRLLPVGPELHRRPAHPRSTPTSTTSSATCWSRRRRRWSPAIRKDRNDLHRPDDLRKEAQAARRLDPGGGREGRDAALRRQARRRDARGDPARRRRPQRPSSTSRRRSARSPS